ncbi:MAG: 16S rRNA (guanine(966)-N(2))-methyltransferase RsmD [Betaproteobacteria bacterium]|nr:MAG: 16S rRNA (guanine(966)-N(2))-methyltransferase RsmD [Betaproteobacteria bacterium]
MAKQHNQVRIIGGQWRRRLLRFPSSADLRPTPDRVRETVFNWLGQSLEGKHCLDLFAGSGALGFEAASRGARQVVMVEHDRVACAALLANVEALRAGNIEVHCRDALSFLDSDQRTFDVVFFDPPYRQGLLPQLLAKIGPHLAAGAVVYLEAHDVPQIPPEYVIARRSRAGQVNYLLLESGDHGGKIQ